MGTTKRSARQLLTITRGRWAAYAAASAATALAGNHSAEAAIHYSGPVNARFQTDENARHRFPLDQPGDFIAFEHNLQVSSQYGPFAGFQAAGLVSGTFRFTPNFDYYIVAKLPYGENVSNGLFGSDRRNYFGFMAGERAGSYYGEWTEPGVGFIGFKFNSGAGVQYGWARVRMTGARRGNGFELIDYAYADPGETITAGQRSSDAAPDLGSLGGLALGMAGFLFWRKHSESYRVPRQPR